MAATPRLGFCCKLIPEDRDPAVARRMNVAAVTMAYLARQSAAGAGEKLRATVAHNLAALDRQIAHVAAGPPLTRLLRMASSLLPGYTHPSCTAFYGDPGERRWIEDGLANAGAAARAGGVRLSMHPGPFC